MPVPALGAVQATHLHLYRARVVVVMSLKGPARGGHHLVRERGAPGRHLSGHLAPDDRPVLFEPRAPVPRARGKFCSSVRIKEGPAFAPARHNGWVRETVLLVFLVSFSVVFDHGKWQWLGRSRLKMQTRKAGFKRYRGRRVGGTTLGRSICRLTPTARFQSCVLRACSRVAEFVTHGRANFPQDSFHMQEEIADDEPSAEGTSIERVESFDVSALISEGAELLDRLQPKLADELVDMVHEGRPTSQLARELSRKVREVNRPESIASTEHVEGASSVVTTSGQDYTMSMDESEHGSPRVLFERVESYGVSALISEGAELLDRLQPELVDELVNLVSRPTSPLAMQVSRKVKEVNRPESVASTEHVEGASSLVTTSGQDYTMSMDESEHSSPSRSLPQELVKAENRSPVRAESDASVSGTHANATISPSRRASERFDEDVRSLFMSCLTADDCKIDQGDASGQADVAQLVNYGRLRWALRDLSACFIVCIISDVVFVAFVALVQHLLNFKSLGRSNLMHHGFTAKQSSWILTSLEEGLGGRQLVSLLQLRNAVLPVLQVTLILPRRYITLPCLLFATSLCLLFATSPCLLFATSLCELCLLFCYASYASSLPQGQDSRELNHACVQSRACGDPSVRVACV